jgi:WD40 repeat protein
MRRFAFVLLAVLLVSYAAAAQEPLEFPPAASLGHTGQVRSIAFSPSAAVLASAGDDDIIRLWEPRAGTLLRRIAAEQGGVRCLSWSADNRWLASAGADGSVRIFTADGDLVSNLQISQDVPIVAVAFSPVAPLLAAGFQKGEQRAIEIWDMRNGAVLHTLENYGEPLAALAFSPDGQYLASAIGGLAGDPHTVEIWDVNGASLAHSLRSEHSDRAVAVAWSADGRWVGAADPTGWVELWHPLTEEWVNGFECPLAPRSLAFSPDARYLLAGGGGDVWRYSLVDLRLGLMRAGLDPVTSVAYSPDGQWMAAGAGRAALVWPTVAVMPPLPAAPPAVTQPPVPVVGPPASPQVLRAVGQFFDDGTLGLIAWDDTPPSPAAWFWSDADASMHPLSNVPGKVTCAAINATHSLAVLGGVNGRVTLYDLRSLAMVRSLDDLTADVDGIAFSPDSRCVAASSHDGKVATWDVGSGRALHTMPTDEGTHALVFSPDSTMVAVASGQRVLVWGPTSGQMALMLTAPETVHSIAFDASSRRLACGLTARAMVWELSHSDAPLHVNAQDGVVTAVAFAPDGRALATAGNQGRVEMAALPLGTQLLAVDGAGRDDLMFSAHGRFLGARGGDGQVRFYDVPSGRLVMQWAALRQTDGSVTWQASRADGEPVDNPLGVLREGGERF